MKQRICHLIGVFLGAKTLLLFLLFTLSQQIFADSGRAYLDVIPVFWSKIYPEGGKTLYCGRPFARNDREVNIEHVYPMGWAAKTLGCGSRDRCRRVSPEFNRIESDMHNLFPARKDINKLRGAYAYGTLKGERRAERGCDFEVNHRSRRVEPRPAVRGDIARAMFYMADRYGLEIYKRQRALLINWHRQDPTDQEEQRRNALIERLQGNRNRFIDDPGRVR